MKTKWIVLISIAALSLVYLSIRFNFWDESLLIIYLMFYALIFVFSYVGLRDMHKKTSDFGSYFLWYLPLSKRNFLNKLRHYGAEVLTAITIGFAWPVLIYYMIKVVSQGEFFFGNKDSRYMRVNAHFKLYPIDNAVLTFNIFVSLVLIILDLNNFNHVLIYRIALLLVIISSLAYLMTSLINKYEVIERFKCSALKVTQNLIINSVLLFFTLLMSILVLQKQVLGVTINLDSFFNLLKDFFSYKKIALTIYEQGTDVNWFTAFIGFVSVLFTFTVVSTIKKYKRYSRDKDHYYDIVKSFITLKQYDEAKKWLWKVNYDERDANYRILESILYLTDNEAEKAVKSMKTTFVDFENEGFDIVERAYNECFTMMRLHHLKPSTFIPLLNNWLKDTKNTPLVCFKTFQFCFNELRTEEDLEEFKQLLTNNSHIGLISALSDILFEKHDYEDFYKGISDLSTFRNLDPQNHIIDFLQIWFYLLKCENTNSEADQSFMIARIADFSQSISAIETDFDFYYAMDFIVVLQFLNEYYQLNLKPILDDIESDLKKYFEEIYYTPLDFNENMQISRGLLDEVVKQRKQMNQN